MRFYLYQMNGKLGDMQGNKEKVLAFTKNFGKDDCTLLPALALIQHPHTAIDFIGGFSERVNTQRLTHTASNILAETLNQKKEADWEKSHSFSYGSNLFSFGNIHIFAPHCLGQYGETLEDFNAFLKELPVSSKANCIYLATAHAFYEGFEPEPCLQKFAKEHKKIVVYVNACGASDGIVYAGQSMLIDKDGKILLRLAPFCEDSAWFDFDGMTIEAEQKTSPVYSADALLFLGATQAIHDYAHKTGIKKAVIGLSGGMDSALVAAMSCEAMGSENIVGILMPSKYNSKESMDDALSLAKNLGMRYHILPISDITQSFEETLSDCFAKEQPANTVNDTTFENIQARTRGNLLTAFANRINAMVISTGNKSEAAMGYCTLYGDTVGAIEPIADIYKSRAYALADWYNKDKGQEIIPRNVFIKAPTAELRPDQKDEDTLPPYPYLDAVLYQLLEEGKNPSEISEKHLCEEDIRLIFHRLKTSEFKRKQCPFPVILSSCPFGKKYNPPSSAKAF